MLSCPRTEPTFRRLVKKEDNIFDVFLRKLAPESDRYLNNDLHLRDVPEDEPINAHFHLMAMMLTTSEVVPIVKGKLALGTWQFVLFFELDGPRKGTVFLQISGE